MRRLDLRGDPGADLLEVVRHLDAGAPIAYPTETVYGLGGAATADAGRPYIPAQGQRRAQAAARARPLARGRPAAGLDGCRQRAGLGFLARSAHIGLVGPAPYLPFGVRSPDAGAVGVRVRRHPLVKRLLSVFGRPITSTSLNRAGEALARSGTEAAEVLERMDPEDDILVIDGGVLPPSAPSTVVDCTGPVPVVLRPGSIPLARLRCVIPEIHERPTT